MAFGLGEDRRRRRRRMRWTLFKWMLALGLIGLAGYWAYQEGARLASSEVVRLERDIDTLSSTVADLRQRNTEQQSEVAAARDHAEEWRQRYERDVPTGDVKALFDLVRAKLDAGVPADRLGFVIDAAQKEDECTDDPETKRIVIPTPLNRGAGDSTRFADGALIVRAAGVTARDAAGNIEAWFDAAEPVQVRITHISGKEWEFSGVLPLNLQIVVADKEYRFNLASGARGYVEVTGQVCRYP